MPQDERKPEKSMRDSLQDVYQSARRMAKVRYSVVTSESLSERLASERTEFGKAEQPRTATHAD